MFETRLLLSASAAAAAVVAKFSSCSATFSSNLILLRTYGKNKNEGFNLNLFSYTGYRINRD